MKKPGSEYKGNITDEVIQAIETEFGKGSVTTLGTMGVVCDITNWTSTGSLLLDLAIGKGLPAGRLTEIYGDTSTGKSTLVAHIIAEHQKSGGVAVLFDTEFGFLPEQAKRIGVDTDKLIYPSASNLQEVFTMMQLSIQRAKISKDTRPLLIVWDSVAATPTREELEGEFGKSHMGLHARLISQAVRKITSMIAQENVSLVFVNQIRSNLGVTFGSAVTTLGGYAIPFYSSVRIQLNRVGYLRVPATNEIYGILVRCRITKNKVAPPFKEAVLHLDFEKGIVDAATWMNYLVEKRLIVKSGSWYTFKNSDGTELKLQYNSYLKKIEEDEVFRNTLKKLILESYHIVRT